MNDYIRVCDVEKYYGNGSNVTKAIDRVSFQVAKGEFVGVMGASGSGKTTLLNMMSTIDRVTAGHIYYGDVDITELSEDGLSDFRKNNLGFVFQDYNLLDTLTIEENIVLAMTLHKEGRDSIKKKCAQMLRLLEITEIKDNFPYQVSGGQKQRCACARALVNNPRLILADEPTGNLDSHSTDDIIQILKGLHKAGKTVIVITHDPDIAAKSRRVVRLEDGQIVEDYINEDYENENMTHKGEKVHV